MDFSRWAISESNIEEPQVEENVDKMGDILNNFMEPDDGGNRSDCVDEWAMRSNQYFDDLFT